MRKCCRYPIDYCWGLRLRQWLHPKLSPNSVPVYAALRHLPTFAQSTCQCCLLPRHSNLQLTSTRKLLTGPGLYVSRLLQPVPEVHKLIVQMQRTQLRLPSLCNIFVSESRRSATREFGFLLFGADERHETVAVAFLVEFVDASAGNHVGGGWTVYVGYFCKAAGECGRCV